MQVVRRQIGRLIAHRFISMLYGAQLKLTAICPNRVFFIAKTYAKTGIRARKPPVSRNPFLPGIPGFVRPQKGKPMRGCAPASSGRTWESRIAIFAAREMRFRPAQIQISRGIVGAVSGSVAISGGRIGLVCVSAGSGSGVTCSVSSIWRGDCCVGGSDRSDRFSAGTLDFRG